MAGTYRQSNNQNRSRFYILLSLVFVGVMFKWGLPAFIGVLSGTGAQKSVKQEKDIIPPQPPIISALPEATNSARITVEGFTEAMVNTDLYINDILVINQKTNDDGSFKLAGVLKAGDNRVIVKATDEAGNTSQSVARIINLDEKPIKLTLENPKDGSEYFGKNSQVVDVTGTVSKPDSQVLVNNFFTTVGNDGKFTQRIQLSDGENTIKAIATDKAGNQATVEIKVRFIP